MKRLEMTRRRQQNYLEALDRMRHKPRSQASLAIIDRLIERVQTAKIVRLPGNPAGRTER